MPPGIVGMLLVAGASLAAASPGDSGGLRGLVLPEPWQGSCAGTVAWTREDCDLGEHAFPNDWAHAFEPGPGFTGALWVHVEPVQGPYVGASVLGVEPYLGYDASCKYRDGVLWGCADFGTLPMARVPYRIACGAAGLGTWACTVPFA